VRAGRAGSVRYAGNPSVALDLRSLRALPGTRSLRIVVVRDPSGRRRDDCFFTTDLSMTPAEIVETIAKR
jgi:hypothetical protein